MPERTLMMVMAFSMLLIGGQERLGSTGQTMIRGKDSSSVTEVLRVLGKGADHIVVGEQRLYVVPGISSLVSSYGTAIELSRLRTPCLAEVSYVGWIKGIDKQPVVLHLEVKKVYSGAGSEIAGE